MDLKEAQIVAERLMEQHGLMAKGWAFAWDSASRRAGCVDFRKRKITLSRMITEANPRTHLVDTMLHEIAHALVGPGHGHDKVWKAMARGIGCTGDRCFTKETRRPPGKWVGICPACGCSHARQRLTGCAVSCGKCSPNKFNLKFLLKWELASKKFRPAKAKPEPLQLAMF